MTQSPSWSLSDAGLLAPLDRPAPLNLMFLELLQDAEARYGERDRSWTFGGLSYRETGGPGLLPSTDGRKWVAIVLTVDALNDVFLQRWQLAHEVVHLLNPPSRETASVFEEGLASFNQFVHSQGRYTGENLLSRSPLNYQLAFELVRGLVEAHPDGVRNMRAENGALSPLSAVMIQKHFPRATAPVAERLSSMFYQPGWDTT